MAVLSPVTILLIPFLIGIIIPLAIFAGFTTIIAFAVLFFRAALIYIDIAVRIVPYYLFGWVRRRNQERRLRRSSVVNSPSWSRRRSGEVVGAGGSPGRIRSSPTKTENGGGEGHAMPVTSRRRSFSGIGGDAITALTPQGRRQSRTLNKSISMDQMASISSFDLDFESVGAARLDALNSDVRTKVPRRRRPNDFVRRSSGRPPSGDPF